MQQFTMSTASKSLRHLAAQLQIAKPWTWVPTSDGGAVIISKPRGYEPRDFNFSADELRESAEDLRHA